MNAEKLLGSLVGSFFSTATGSKAKQQGRVKSGAKGVLNKVKGQLTSGKGVVAALGLAFGAFEAYKMSSGAGGAQAAPPPLPDAASAAPPPLPGAASAAPPPLPSAACAAPSDIAIRLIQAMIAAAHADGVLDETERGRILGKVKESGLGEEEEKFILAEMEHPKSIQELTAGLEAHEARKLMYGLSVAAIDTDTAEEIKYLEDLGSALGLGAEEKEELRKRFEMKEEQ